MLRRHKGKLAVIAALVVVVVAVLRCVPSSRPPVRLTFLYLTNSLLPGRVGVFELANPRTESVSSRGGDIQPANRTGLVPRLDKRFAPFADLRPQQFAARSTNIIHILLLATNAGPYKLVLPCIPASGLTPRVSRRYSSRIANLLWPSLTARLHGMIFAESQPFTIAP